MEFIKLDIEKIFGAVDKDSVQGLREEAQKANKALEEGTGKGSDYLGWVNLPSSVTEQQLSDIENTANNIKKEVDIIVVIGIGGSYLGTKAVADALSDTFSHLKGSENPHILFAGHNIGEDYLTELIQLLDNKRYGIVVISKSGTTTEPAIAFRILKNHLENKVGANKAKELIIAITDKSKGALRALADQNGYKSFVIEDNIGGRYSVLTPVGLVPLAIGGFNIRSLIQGALEMEKNCHSEIEAEKNPAIQYAAARIALYNSGKKIEILANYENKLHYIGEWWKQLFGESDGKDGIGLFPASIDLTADLHSMGQYIQEGERTLIETVISVAKTKYSLSIPSDNKDLDGLNYLEGKNIDHVNKMAELGTKIAHIDGQVPNIRIELPELNERFIGQLIYFFERACGIGGYLMDINPFNQPGVEAYKTNMFALLEKPGFEEETWKIKKRL